MLRMGEVGGGRVRGFQLKIFKVVQFPDFAASCLYSAWRHATAASINRHLSPPKKIGRFDGGKLVILPIQQ